MSCRRDVGEGRLSRISISGEATSSDSLQPGDWSVGCVLGRGFTLGRSVPDVLRERPYLSGRTIETRGRVDCERSQADAEQTALRPGQDQPNGRCHAGWIFDWIKASLQPVIMGPNGEILGGHHRVIAASLAGVDLPRVPGPRPQVRRLPSNFRPVYQWIDVLPGVY
jgi:hypothetical protein